MDVDIAGRVKERPSFLPFEKIARSILPKGYVLSVVLCGDTLSKRLNKTYRKKDYPTNVLSFPLSKNEGEIFLNMRKTEREAKSSGRSKKDHAAYLFIHGLLHLKGYTHGSTMENEEKRFLARFGYSH